MPRTLSAPARGWFRDVLLLTSRLVVSVVMLAHVWQTFGRAGFASTTVTFANLGIPIAIVATAFTLVVELTGSLLLMFGVLTRWAAAGFTFVMGGAIVFVHAQNGIFVKTGGWELVGMIIAVVLAIAANGPGRISVDHLISLQRERTGVKRTATVVSATLDAGRHPSPRRPVPVAYRAGDEAEPVTDARGFPMLSSRFVPLGRPAAAAAGHDGTADVPTSPQAGDGAARHGGRQGVFTAR